MMGKKWISPVKEGMPVTLMMRKTTFRVSYRKPRIPPPYSTIHIIVEITNLVFIKFISSFSCQVMWNMWFCN